MIDMRKEQPLIVVADDSAAIREMLIDVLIEEGYCTISCNSGAKALEHIQREKPDLVILDMQMEHRNAGLSVLEQMRSEASTKHIPVILYSADSSVLTEKEPQIHAYRADVLYKPFGIDDLLFRVERMLNTRYKPVHIHIGSHTRAMEGFA